MKKLILALVLISLSSCGPYDRAQVLPESLLSVSSENVTFNLSDKASIDSVISWAQDDAPAEIEVSCRSAKWLCADLLNKMRNHNIQVRLAETPHVSDSATLIYERVTAHNCSPAGFGCATSVNTVQMVADRAQFTRPKLSSPRAAAKAVESYENYITK